MATYDGRQPISLGCHPGQVLSEFLEVQLLLIPQLEYSSMRMGVRQQGMQMDEERVNRVLRLKTDEGLKLP